MPKTTVPIFKGDETPRAAIRRSLAPVAPDGTTARRDIESTLAFPVVRDQQPPVPGANRAGRLPVRVLDPTQRIYGREEIETARWDRVWADQRAAATHQVALTAAAFAKANAKVNVAAQRFHDESEALDRRLDAYLDGLNARLDVAAALAADDEAALSTATAHAMRIKALLPATVSHVLHLHAATGEFPAVAA